MSESNPKFVAAKAALAHIHSGMKLGLGTGSTAAIFVDLLADKISKENLDLVCVPTSIQTQNQAQSLGIKLDRLDNLGRLDVVVDGADEIDTNLCLIKGGGGALLREKIVAAASDKMIVIADTQKKSQNLGSFPLPIEVIEFGMAQTLGRVKALLENRLKTSVPCMVRQNEDGSFYKTDENNLIIDAQCSVIIDPAGMHDALCGVTGVVEHGLFVGLADFAIIGSDHGVEIIKAE